METVFPDMHIYVYICVYVMESLYSSSSIFVVSFFFFSSSIFVQKSIIRHQKNFTPHFSPAQLFNKFDPRLKFYLSDTRFRNQLFLSSLIFFVDSLLKKKLVFDYCIYLFFRNNEYTWRFHYVYFTIDSRLRIDHFF